MRRSIPEECEAQTRHAQWLQHYQSFSDKEAPLPGYKDCPNCPLRAQADSEDERRSICEACPWANYPDSPSVEFLLAASLAGMPDYFLARLELTDRQHRNVATIRNYRNDAREMERLTMILRCFGG